MKNAKILIEEKPVTAKTISYRNTTASWPFLNMVLLVLAGVLGIWYALWANFIVSGQYRESLLEKKLAVFQEANNLLLSEKSSSANLGALLVFSKQAGLVEQKNIEYIFDRRKVAEVSRNLSH